MTIYMDLKLLCHTYIEGSSQELSIRSSEADVDLYDLNTVNLIFAGLSEYGRVQIEHHTAVVGCAFHHCILTHAQYVTTKVLELGMANQPQT